MKYRYNPYCPCGRCRAHGLMGPAVLITLGVLFLLNQAGHQHWMDFDFTWPALLIVVGVIKLLEHSASIGGHVPREYGQNLPPNVGQPGMPVYPTQPQPPIVTQPPATPAGFITPGQGPDDKGVHNG
jgi:Domain of unknown function (DUF5668)